MIKELDPKSGVDFKPETETQKEIFGLRKRVKKKKPKNFFANVPLNHPSAWNSLQKCEEAARPTGHGDAHFSPLYTWKELMSEDILNEATTGDFDLERKMDSVTECDDSFLNFEEHEPEDGDSLNTPIMEFSHNSFGDGHLNEVGSAYLPNNSCGSSKIPRFLKKTHDSSAVETGGRSRSRTKRDKLPKKERSSNAFLKERRTFEAPTRKQNELVRKFGKHNLLELREPLLPSFRETEEDLTDDKQSTPPDYDTIQEITLVEVQDTDVSKLEISDIQENEFSDSKAKAENSNFDAASKSPEVSQLGDVIDSLDDAEVKDVYKVQKNLLIAQLQEKLKKKTEQGISPVPSTTEVDTELANDNVINLDSNIRTEKADCSLEDSEGNTGDWDLTREMMPDTQPDVTDDEAEISSDDSRSSEGSENIGECTEFYGNLHQFLLTPKEIDRLVRDVRNRSRERRWNPDRRNAVIRLVLIILVSIFMFFTLRDKDWSHFENDDICYIPERN